MTLSNPETRRGLRSVVQAVVALAVIGLLYWLTYRLDDDADALLEIARGALAIVGVGTLLYGAENVTRAVRVKGAGFEASIGDEQ